LSGEKHIILDYEVEHVTRILRQADEVHFMGDYQSYVITNLVSVAVRVKRTKYIYNGVVIVLVVSGRAHVEFRRIRQIDGQHNADPIVGPGESTRQERRRRNHI